MQTIKFIVMPPSCNDRFFQQMTLQNKERNSNKKNFPLRQRQRGLTKKSC